MTTILTPQLRPRKIIHIDMDAYFASIEQRDDPALRGRPVVVGGDPGNRGVVASASYEARKFGIRSAMSSAQAYQLCRSVLFIQPHFEKYVLASQQMRAIFETVTPLIEPLSLDEAYLDVTENLLKEPLARTIAIYLKKRILEVTGLTASAGVGPNKFIAKLASDHQKPNGLVVVPPEKVFAFIENLAVEKFWGVGPATTKKLHQLGIKTAADLRKKTVPELERILGSYGSFLYELAHGRDDREVDTSQEPKSRGSEMTFDQDILNPETLLKHLEEVSHELSKDLKKLDCTGKTITLKLRYSDFKTITRSRTLAHPTSNAYTIAQTVADLLYKSTDVGDKPVRLIGVSISGFTNPEEPLQLWFDFLTDL